MTSPSISADDQRLLRAAASLRKKLVRASSIAWVNGLGYVLFGGLTLALALPGFDLLNLAQGALVAGVGILQRKQAPLLEAGDPGAARALARNELVLMGGLVLYCLVHLLVLQPDALMVDLDRQLAAQSGMDIEGLTDALHSVLFGSLLVTALIYQGGLALYYYRRIPVAEQYRSEVPGWARESLLGT